MLDFLVEGILGHFVWNVLDAIWVRRPLFALTVAFGLVATTVWWTFLA